MSKNLLYALLVILASLDIYLLVKVRQPKEMLVASAVRSGRPHAADSSENLVAYANSLRGRILLQAKYAKIGIAGSPKVMDTLGHEVYLKDVISGKENLVFFFTYKHCYSCIDAAIPNLERLAEKIGYDKVFLVGDFYERRDILTFRSKYKSRLRIYSIGDAAIEADAKELNFPFMFLLDKDLHARSLFFSEKDLPQVTSDFMNEMLVHFQAKDSHP